MAGGLTGVGLYVLNWGATALLWPAYGGSELPVLFTHFVFGLVAGGAYRGLLRRKPAEVAHP